MASLSGNQLVTVHMYRQNYGLAWSLVSSGLTGIESHLNFPYFFLAGVIFLKHMIPFVWHKGVFSPLPLIRTIRIFFFF
jgi:hypothetical protein